MDEITKDQLVKCLIDLSDRFGELGDEYTRSVLLCVAGTVKEGSEEVLAIWMGEYAKIRIEMLNKKLKTYEEDNFWFMKLYEQIDHALDIKARIQDYLVELDNIDGYVAPSDVINRINSIFNKAEDAKFELKCRQSDLGDDAT